jgi:hypothetical protein
MKRKTGFAILFPGDQEELRRNREKTGGGIVEAKGS